MGTRKEVGRAEVEGKSGVVGRGGGKGRKLYLNNSNKKKNNCVALRNSPSTHIYFIG